MATPSWLKELARQWFAGRRVRRREARSTVRLQVEQLETRLTPSGNSFQIGASPAPILGYEFQGTVGQPFSETLSGPSSGTNSYAVAQGQLPPGTPPSGTSGTLYLNASTGLISGTPSTPGQYNVAFQVTNTISGTETTVFQFLISPQAAATITSGSNIALPPTSPITINVNSTAGFPSSGSIEIQTGAGVSTTVQYNGLSPNGTAFLNVTGGTGTLQTGDLISPQTAPAATIAIGSNNVPLPTGTIYVSSTAGFPSTNGAIEIQTGAGVTTLVRYGKLSTSGSPAFLNVTGGTGTLQTGDFVITAPAFSVSTTMQPLNALNALQYNNQTLPLGIVDQPYNATINSTNPNDQITGIRISTYNTSGNVSAWGSPNSTIAGIYVTPAAPSNAYSITGLDGASGSALKVSLTSGNVTVSGTPTFSSAGFSYPLFLSVTFQDGTTHNFNFSFGYSPQEIENAYGFNQLPNGYDGAGQTIVILENGGVPNLVSSTDPNFANSDLNQFDQIFPGLNTFGQPGGPVFLTLNSAGSTHNGSGGDETEIIQDIEWAHALAPMANIVDMEGSIATSLSTIEGTNGNVNTSFWKILNGLGLPTSTSSLYVVGTSFGASIGNPNSLGNVTFVASSGDNGSTATSGNVVLTGYTQLTQSPTSSRVSEAAVNGVPDNFRSGGNILQSGGSSSFPGSSQQSYQSKSGIYSGTTNQFSTPVTGRAGPDVSFNGSPESGDVEFNSLINSASKDNKPPKGTNAALGGGPWEDAWGTSIASPSWDAIFAIVNQERAAVGKPSLSGTSQTLPMLYSQAGSSAFHQISTSTTGNLSPSPITAPSASGGAIYNIRAGLGTPVADILIPDLVGPTLTPSSAIASSSTLTLTGSHFLKNATYSVTFTNPNVTRPATYTSPTTLTVGNLSLSGLAPGTPLLATVTMTTTTGPIYTDTTGASVQVAITPTIAVGPLPNQLPPAALSSLTPYSQTFTASGGLGTLYFSEVGNLPPGMTLNPTTGVLSGNPTGSPNAYTFTVYATDSAGDTGSQTYTLNVNSAITIGPAPVPAVAGVTVTSGGNNYTSAPTVTFSAPTAGGVTTGITATGTATTKGGVVTAVNITNPGNGYTSAPTITFSGGGGSGAAATADITTSAGAVYPLPAGTNGQTYSALLAANGGAGGYTYAPSPSGTLSKGGLYPLGNGLLLDPKTGAISGQPTQGGLFTVTATDRAGASNSQEFSVSVGTLGVSASETLGKSTLSLPPNVFLPAAVVNDAYAPSSNPTFTASGGATGDSFTFSFPNGQSKFDGLSLKTTGNTATLTGTPSFGGTYNVTVVATDTTANLTGEQNYLLTVNLKMKSPSSLSAGTIGNSYSSPTFQAEGGNSGDSYSFSALNLPPGLTLTNGMLSGTPTVTGTFTFDVSVTDTNDPALTGSQQYNLTITGPTLPSPLTTPKGDNVLALPAGTVGVPYATSVTISNGTGYQETGLPQGLALDPSTGGIAGTPQQSGTFYVHVTATDSSTGQQGGAIYPLFISPGLTLRPGSLPPASQKVPYVLPFTALGGSGDYTFAGLTVPAGLAMSSSGVLSGSPTSAGPQLLTVRVNDNDNPNLTLTQQYYLNVGALTVGPTNTVLSATAGTLYGQQFTASPGTGPYDFSETGSLPGGITLSPSGTLSGTPTAVGTYNFTVSVTDSSSPNLTGSQQYTLTVVSPSNALAITPSVLPPATTGSDYKDNGITLTTSGGVGAPTFTLTNKPSWLSLSSGQLTGKPPDSSANTTAAVTVTATWTDNSKPKLNTPSPASGGDLTSGNTYYWVITATNANGESIASKEVSLTPTAAALAPPTLNTPTPSTTGGSLPAGTYNYEVTALNANGETTASNQVSVTTTGTTSSVPLTWGAVTGATGYKIYRASGGFSYYYSISGGGTTSYTDTGATPSGGGLSPTNNTTAQSANLSWTAVPGATGYKVYRGTVAGKENVLVAALGGNSTTTFSDTGAAGVSAKPPTVSSLSLTGSQTYTLSILPKPPAGYSSQLLAQAYGINNVIFSGGVVGNGAGQTIAIISTGDDPAMVSSTNPNFANSDLAAYDGYHGLPNFNETVGGFAGTSSNGSSTISGVSGLSGVAVGMGVEGPGIPAGDTIAAIGASSVTLTVPAATGAGTGAFTTTPFFLKLDDYGGTTYPGIANSKGNIGVGENSLDIETIHSLAPEANIIDFETGGSSFQTVLQTAMSYPGVTVVSISATASQDSGLFGSQSAQAATDPSLLALESNPNVTVLIAAGDNNKKDPGDPATYPASSPYVLAVGASQLTTDPQGNYLGELGLNQPSNGPSNYEAQPFYQAGVATAANSVPATTIAVSSGTNTLSQITTITVASNLSFPTSGTLEIETSNGPALATYTTSNAGKFKRGDTSFKFTFGNLTVVYPTTGTGTLAPGDEVVLVPTAAPATTITTSGGQTLPQSILYVASTVGFPTAGTLTVQTSQGNVVVAYKGITGTTFTGVTTGGVKATLTTGGQVKLATLTQFTSTPVDYPPITTITGSPTLPQGRIQVASTANFPTTGALVLQTTTGSLTLVNYTGIASSGGNVYFTGITGGSGVLANGGLVTLASVQRATPDVAFNGSSHPGFGVYDSLKGNSPFFGRHQRGHARLRRFAWHYQPGRNTGR